MKSLNFNTGTNVPNVVPLHESRKDALRDIIKPKLPIGPQPQNAFGVSLEEQQGPENLIQETSIFTPTQIPKTTDTSLAECQKELKLPCLDNLDQIEIENEHWINNWENKLNSGIEMNEQLDEIKYGLDPQLNYYEVAQDYRGDNLIKLIDLFDEHEQEFCLSLEDLEIQQELILDCDLSLNQIELAQKIQANSTWETQLDQSLEQVNQLNLEQFNQSNTSSPIWGKDLNQYLEQQHHQSGLSGPLEALEPVEVHFVHPHRIDPQHIHPTLVTSYTIKFANDSGNSGGFGGFGGGNANNGDWDAFGEHNPAFLFVFSFLLFIFAIWLYNFAISGILKTLKQFNQYLNRLADKNPQRLTTKIYSLFLKTLVSFLALLASPEAFALTLQTLGGPRVQNFLRILSFLFRGAIAASLFLGGAPFLINWYQHLMNIIGPVLDKTINILAGPQTVTLPVLFIEKTLKCILASLCYGGVCVFIRHAKNSNKHNTKPAARCSSTLQQHAAACLRACVPTTNKFKSILLILGFSYGVYFILTDFIWLRKLASNVAAHDLITPLVMSQLGRMSLVIGSLLFIRQFSFLPGTQAIFVILLYALGVYSLAFSASSNLFPSK